MTANAVTLQKMPLFGPTRGAKLRKARKDAIAEWAPIAQMMLPGEQPRWSGDVLFGRPDVTDPDSGHIWLTSARLIFMIDPSRRFPDGQVFVVPIGRVTEARCTDDWLRYQLVTVDDDDSTIYSFQSPPDNLSRMLVHELFLAISEEVDRPRATGH